MSNLLKSIHNMISKDGYMPSFDDLLNIDSEADSFSINYYHIANRCNRYSTPDIVITVSFTDDLILYLLTHNSIELDVFDCMDSIGFGMTNTLFSYSDKPGNFHHSDISDIFSNYEENNDAFHITTTSAKKFIKLYNINKNYDSVVKEHIDKFLNDVEAFKKQYGNILTEYGFFKSIYTSGRENELSHIGEIQFTCLDSDEYITLFYDISKEKTVIFYHRKYHGIYESFTMDLDKINEAKLQRILKSTLHLLYEPQIECMLHKDDSVTEKTYEYVSAFLHDIIYAENDLNHISEILKYTIWELIPHNPSMKEFIKKYIPTTSKQLITDHYFI